MRLFKLTSLCAAAVGVALGGFTSVDVAPSGDGALPKVAISFGAPAAEAHVRSWAHPHPHGPARRAARRTTRRAIARAAYRTSVAGCLYRAPYYVCDGVYFEPEVRDGVTVYAEIDVNVDVDVDR